MQPKKMRPWRGALPALIGLTGWPRFGRLAAMRAAMDRHHPLERPHDYLFFLGVVPEAQGHGIGSRRIPLCPQHNPGIA